MWHRRNTVEEAYIPTTLSCKIQGMNSKLTLKKSMFFTILDIQDRVCLMGIFPQESNFPHTKENSKGHTALIKISRKRTVSEVIAIN